MKASIKTIITIAILYFIITLFSSCKKEEYILFVEEPEVVDTTSWQSTYNNGGTLTGNPSQTNNLVGTKWVLTKVVSAFSTEYPNDTITFTTNNDYVLNHLL